nr:ATP-dependent acyl-CoA ligase [Natronomonas marina]
MTIETPPGPEVPPDEYETVTDVIEDKVARKGDDPLMHFKEEVYSYEDIDAKANAIAASLQGLGIEKGDKVCTFLYNSPDYLALWFGIAKAGAVLVPLNVSLKANGLAYNINDSDADTVVLEEGTRENYETARDDLENVEREYLMGDGADGEDGYRSFDTLLDGDADASPDVSLGPDDPMCILYTSGTTGMPKGVVLPHYSYVNTGWEYCNNMLTITEDDRLFTHLPLFHVNAQQTTVMGALLAETDFAMETWFSASEYFDQIREYDATIFNYIGTMIPVLFKQEEREDDADNPARVGIGAAAPPDIIEDFEERFDVFLREGYGLTETGTSACINPADERRIGSVGKSLTYTELEIVDEHDRPLPPGEEGEIVVRNTRPNTVMQEYYKKPEKTAETFRNLWIHTGDIGKKDEDGFFYFVDRKAYAIRRRGENVSSFEVEAAIESHPDVQEAAVFGVPSELGEDEVTAAIIPKSGADLEPLDIVKHCEERLAYFKVPRYVRFVDDFPKTATERVEKYKLKEEGVDDAWDREEAGYELER